jgi:hypothetical protein
MATSDLGLTARQIERLWQETYEERQATYNEMAQQVHQTVDSSMMQQIFQNYDWNSVTITNTPLVGGENWYIMPDGNAGFTNATYGGVSDAMKGQVDAPKKLNKKVDVRKLNKLLIKLKHKTV